MHKRSTTGTLMTSITRWTAVRTAQLLAVGALALGSVVGVSAADTYTNTQTYTLQGTQIAIDVQSPLVSIEAWAGTDTEVVVAQVGGSAGTYIIDVVQDGSTVRVTQQPHSCSPCGRLDITVKTPSSNQANVLTRSGSVKITGLNGGVTVNGASGPVTINDVSGATVRTSSGPINYRGALTAGGNYSFIATSGTVTAFAPTGSNFQLLATATTGSVVSDFVPTGGTITSKTVSGTVGASSTTSLRLGVTTGRVFLRRY